MEAADAALQTLLRVGAREHDLSVLMKELASFNIFINGRIYIRVMINGKNKDCLLLDELTGPYSKQTLAYLRETPRLEGGHGMLLPALQFLNERLTYERNERLRRAAAI